MFAISPTDIEWFEFLKSSNLTEYINFWTPSPWNLHKLNEGDKLYFMLKSPIRRLGGYGHFVQYVNMSINTAWREFGLRNGCKSKLELVHRLQKYNKSIIDPSVYEIGCIVLKECVYWANESFKLPDYYGITFQNSIVKIKYFHEEDPFVEESNIDSLSPFKLILDSEIENTRKTTVRQRVGQSQFKSIISRIYDNSCCITGEICPELLEAAHIQPYVSASSNHYQNGLLLRVDFHKLYDNGLLYIDDTYKIHVSSRIINEDYQRYHGKFIRLPKDERKWPSEKALKSREVEFRP